MTPSPIASRPIFSFRRALPLGPLPFLALLGVSASAASAAAFTERFDGPLDKQWTGVPAGESNPKGSITLYGAGNGARLTTIPQFRSGKFSVQLKVSGMAAGYYGYFGFFSRAPWAANTVIGMMAGDRIKLQVRRDSGEVAEPCLTPSITPGVWHTLTLDWKPKLAEMLWDGVSCGTFERTEVIPVEPLPAIIDVVGPGEGFKVEVRAVDVENAGEPAPAVAMPGIAPGAAAPAAETVTALSPPLRRPADTRVLKMPTPIAPTSKRDGEKLSVTNAFYKAQVSWQDGLSLSALENRVSGLSCLVPGSQSEFFTLISNEKVLRGSDFKVVKATESNKAGTVKLDVLAESKDKNWQVQFSLLADASPEMRIGLQVRNVSAQERKATIYWPHVTGLQIGAKAEDNYYFFPWQGGWTNNASYQLGSVYGNSTGLMQLFSLFNPAAGSTVYTYLKDSSGRTKTGIMRKDDTGSGKFPSYVPLYPQDQPEPGSLLNQAGTQFAFKPEAFTFAADENKVSPELVLGVAPGDWHQPLKSYSRWAHTWFKDPQIPSWYRAHFETVAVHDVGGNKGFENGFVNGDKWALGDRAQPADDLLEVAYWWQHVTLPPGTPPQAQILNRVGIGDYDYWKELGGLAQLRREIEACHKKGIRVNLYTTPRFIWHDSKVAKAHPDWVLYNSDGKVSQDWTATIAGTSMVMDDMCYSVPEWRKYISETVGRIVRDTGCDGVFMDTMNDAKRCFNPAHQHPDSPSFMAEAMLKDYRSALKKANPQAVMTSEDVCSDRLMQYIDGSLLKTFNGGEAMYNDFDLYAVHFVRFYFPEIKYCEWGAKFETGARRAFFNGMGYVRGDLGAAKDPFTDESILSSEQLAYLNKTTRILKENADAFDSRTPEPLVPTLVSGVYANKFPSAKETVWTLYNRTGKDIASNIIAVPHVAGATYVELVHGTVVMPVIRNGVATVKVSIKNGEVLALARRATGFQVRKRAPIQP